MVYTQLSTAQWRTNVPPTNATIAVFIRASDNRLIIKAWNSQLSLPAATTGMRQVPVAGGAPTQVPVQLAAYEWPFPMVVDAPTSTNVSGTANILIPGTSMPLQSATSNGNAVCYWQFTKGGTTNPAILTRNTQPTGLQTSTGVKTSGTVLSQTQVAGATTRTPSSAISTTQTSSTPSASAGNVAPDPSSNGATPPAATDPSNTTNPGDGTAPAPNPNTNTDTNTRGATGTNPNSADPSAPTQNVKVFLNPGNAATFTYVWTAPAGVTQVSLQMWGGGGSGALNTGFTSASGGSGGGYSSKLLNVTPGAIYNIIVGGGGHGPDLIQNASGQDGFNSSVSSGGRTLLFAGGGYKGVINQDIPVQGGSTDPSATVVQVGGYGTLDSGGPAPLSTSCPGFGIAGRGGDPNQYGQPGCVVLSW